MATTVKPLTISQWLTQFDRAMSTLEEQLSLMIDAIILKQRSPFNFPRTKKTPDQLFPYLVSALYTAISIALQIQDVLLNNGIPKDKVVTLMVDANKMLNSTTVVKLYQDPKLADTVLKDLTKIKLILSGDLLRIKNWVTENIRPLIK